MELSVVIPCFNESERLGASLSGVDGYLRRRGLSYELVLVDDGSSDPTAELIREAARGQPRVRGVFLQSNRGKGRAVAEGVAVSRGDLVLMSDADFSAPIEQLPRLEAAIAGGAAVAFGSRAAPGAREVDQPLLRRAMGKTFNRLVRLLLLPGVHDTQCGFKLFEGALARQLFAGLRTDGFAFDVEVLYRARRSGGRLAEVPVRWVHSAPTRVSAIQHSLQMLRDLIGLWRDRRSL